MDIKIELNDNNEMEFSNSVLTGPIARESITNYQPQIPEQIYIKTEPHNADTLFTFTETTQTELGDTNKDPLSSNLKNETVPKQWQCYVCKMRFNAKSRLDGHMNVHVNNQQIFTSNNCFGVRQHFAPHIIKCIHCEVMFPISVETSYMESHLKLHHINIYNSLVANLASPAETLDEPNFTPDLSCHREPDTNDGEELSCLVLNYSESENDSSDDLTPPEVREKAANVEANLIPEKSRKKYMRAYNLFMTWKTENICDGFSENVFLAYFNEKSEGWKPTTSWAQYSMLRSTVWLNHKIDISNYKKLTPFLKSKSKGYKSQKATIFTPVEIQKFLLEAPDDKYLAAKVIAVFGLAGACRICELPEITLKHIEIQGDIYLVQIPKTTICQPRSFTITGELAKIVQKYADLRPSNMTTERFFINYQHGKCTIQPIGINKFRKTPQQIAEYLHLKNPEKYTGHSLRRTSASVLVNASAT